MLHVSPDLGRFESLDRIIDVSSVRLMTTSAKANLWCILITFFRVETQCDKRMLLNMDSVVLRASLLDSTPQA